MKLGKSFLVILALMFAAALPSCAAQELEATVHFFNFGKADAILITTAEHAVLIDTGKNKDGTQIVEYLKKNGIAALDVMIITHFDKDHVGGADSVLEAIEVRRVLESDYAADSKQTTQYRQALAEAGIEAEALSRNISFSLGMLEFTIDVADALYAQENDLSLVVRMTCGQTAFLFAGDAEDARLTELLFDADSLACDVLKVPHHGGYEDHSLLFFAACNAKYAVITSSEKDPEDEATILALESAGTEALLTRHSGDGITMDVTADGLQVRFS